MCVSVNKKRKLYSNIEMKEKLALIELSRDDNIVVKTKVLTKGALWSYRTGMLIEQRF